MSNWISVKDRLPELGERVLFLSRNKQQICIGSYRGVGGRGAHYFANGNCLATALWWMPLPEVPRNEMQ